MVDDLHPLVSDLVTRRRDAGISLTEVARRMGASLMTVRRIERGDVSPTVETLERYASAVGSALSWDLGDLAEGIPPEIQVGSRVTVDWGLDDGMPGVVVGLHGSPGRVWLQVELADGPTVDVPADAVKARPRSVRRKAQT